MITVSLACLKDQKLRICTKSGQIVLDFIGGTGVPRLTRFLVARFHFTRILEDVFYSTVSPRIGRKCIQKKSHPI